MPLKVRCLNHDNFSTCFLALTALGFKLNLDVEEYGAQKHRAELKKYEVYSRSLDKQDKQDLDMDTAITVCKLGRLAQAALRKARDQRHGICMSSSQVEVLLDEPMSDCIVID